MSAAGSPNLQLAVLEVLLREEVEVVVERLVARHRDGEGALLVERLDLLDERLGLVVVEERDRDDASHADPPRRARRLGRRGTCARGRAP